MKIKCQKKLYSMINLFKLFNNNLNKSCIAKCENAYILSNDLDYTHFFNLSKQLNPSICKAKSQIPTSE
jgi:hypothetical protein